MSETLEEMYIRVASLPEDLQKIFHNHWDYTGRPTREFSSLIVDLLNKNATANYFAFAEDYKQLIDIKELTFSECEKLQTYWLCFIAGANYIADNIQKRK